MDADQRTANAGASNSGLEQYFANFKYQDICGGANYFKAAGGNDAIDGFITDLESVAGGQAYVNGLVSGGNPTDTDTGSVHGSEYGGAVKDSAAVVDDDASYISGFNSAINLRRGGG